MIRPAHPSPALLALNNAHAEALSPLTPARFAHLVQTATLALHIPGAEALMLAFDHAAAYDSPNYLWFKARYTRFLYIDRIVTAPEARGRGHATRLYAHLIAHARATHHDTLACEVNITPPNPASDRFHAAQGFTEAGRAVLQDRHKTVRYLIRTVA